MTSQSSDSVTAQSADAPWAWGVVLAVLVGAFFLLVEPIPQDPLYHEFVDSRAIFGISNFWNVLSNLGFLLVGGWGLKVVLGARDADLGGQRRPFVVLFSGLVLTGLGSAWYHLSPSNPTLFWDRLPISIAFVGLFTAIIGIYVSASAAKRLLLPFLAAAVAASVYWIWTEEAGRGDLRPYAVVQFLPVLATPVILALRGHRSRLTGYLWIMLGLYVVSKIFEFTDAPVYSALGISGHTLKHVSSAVAAFALAWGIAKQAAARTDDA